MVFGTCNPVGLLVAASVFGTLAAARGVHGLRYVQPRLIVSGGLGLRYVGCCEGS
jgi:hypothetical protein